MRWSFSQPIDANSALKSGSAWRMLSPRRMRVRKVADVKSALLCPAEPRQLTRQRFWDHRGYLGAEAIRVIESDLCRKIMDTYAIDWRCLAFDATNFFTFIRTRTAGHLAQRGPNKNGRDDLRQVCLALLVSTDFHIPLFHQPYNGNVPDSVEFRSVLDELVKR